MIFKNCSELVGKYQIRRMYSWYDMSVYTCDLHCNWCYGRTHMHRNNHFLMARSEGSNLML